MSKLARLIEEFCPNGVVHKSLGEIATEIYRGAGIKREEVTESGTPCVRYGEIYTTYNIWFDTCVSHTDAEKIQSKKYFEYGDVLFAITGESVDEIAKSCVYVGNEKCLAGGDIVVMKHNENPKYLAYALSTTNAQIQKSKGRVKSKVVHSNVPAIRSIVIPLPPLPIQEEIALILDKYILLEAELEAELVTELEARKKQYDYYRNMLLAFDIDSSTIITDRQTDRQVRWLKLNEVGILMRGTYITKKNIAQGDIPVILGGQEPAYYCDIYGSPATTPIFSFADREGAPGAGQAQAWHTR